MSEPNTPKSNRNTKRSDPKTLARFVQELSWLLSSYDELDYKALSILSENLASRIQPMKSKGRTSSPSDAVKLLVGILPNLLVDETLFPANEDISEFALSALNIQILRWQKKSRYELIGHIVCHTNQASFTQLQQIKALAERALDEKDSTRHVMEMERKSGRSWNEVIQKLVRENG